MCFVRKEGRELKSNLGASEWCEGYAPFPMIFILYPWRLLCWMRISLIAITELPADCNPSTPHTPLLYSAWNFRGSITHTNQINILFTWLFSYHTEFSQSLLQLPLDAKAYIVWWQWPLQSPSKSNNQFVSFGSNERDNWCWRGDGRIASHQHLRQHYRHLMWCVAWIPSFTFSIIRGSVISLILICRNYLCALVWLSVTN